MHQEWLKLPKINVKCIVVAWMARMLRVMAVVGFHSIVLHFQIFHFISGWKWEGIGSQRAFDVATSIWIYFRFPKIKTLQRLKWNLPLDQRTMGRTSRVERRTLKCHPVPSQPRRPVWGSMSCVSLNLSFIVPDIIILNSSIAFELAEFYVQYLVQSWSENKSS